MKHISQKDFQNEVLLSNETVIVDFWAPWCGPCLRIAPLLDDLESKLVGKPYKFVKVNVDENQELAAQFQVFSIPTLMKFSTSSTNPDRRVGVLHSDELERWVTG